MPEKQTAFITGASSGIGAEFARQLAPKGYNLIIHGRRENLLSELAQKLQDQHNITVRVVTAELTDPVDLGKLMQVLRDTQNLSILINNAGYTTKGLFHEETLESQINIIRVHLEATIALTHTALPIMLKNNAGTIINVSSVAGFYAAPRSVLYCSTKAFLNTFSESIHMETRDTPLKVQSLCPGFTLTDFHKKLGYDPDHPMFKNFMSAEYVVSKSLQALQKGKVLYVPNYRYKLISMIPRLLPRKLIYRFVGKYYKRENVSKIHGR